MQQARGWQVTLVMAATLASARVVRVGPSQAITTPCAAASVVQNGDTVEIEPATYTNQACSWSADNLTLRATAPYAHLTPPSYIPNRKAIWVITGDNVTVENIEFSDAWIPESDGHNGAGIRQEGNNVTIRNCIFRDCQNGILGGGDTTSTVLIEYCEFARCGNDTGDGAGYTHNMYISQVAEFTLRGCFTHEAKRGHTIKSRARRNFILYNRIMSLSSTTSYEVNLPNGGTSFVIGNVIQQGPSSENSAIIDYGSEGLANHDSALYVINNTIVNDRGTARFISVSHTSNRPVVKNNLAVGSGTFCTVAADTQANIQTNTPDFTDKQGYDYSLTASSPGINQGVDPGSAGGYSLTPSLEYVHPTATRTRTVTGGSLDIGALEFGSATVAYGPSARTNPRTDPRVGVFTLDGRIVPPASLRPGRARVSALTTVTRVAEQVR
jgi:hypothetical protein